MLFRFPRTLACLALLAACCSPGLAEDVASLRLVPFPKDVQLRPGRFRLDRPLVVHAPESLAAAVDTFLVDEFARAGLKPPVVRLAKEGKKGKARGAKNGPMQITVSLASNPQSPIPTQPLLNARGTDEQYTLVVAPDTAAIAAQTRAGLIHGLATLGQLVRANRQSRSAVSADQIPQGAPSAGEVVGRDARPTWTIPCLTIRDWPSVGWRAFQDDLTRGPSTKLCQLKRDVARGRLLKLNIFTYYMEYQFAFSKHPLLGSKDGSLTPAELAALVEHARPLGMHVLGNQQSFAHMQRVLSHPEYAQLREDERTLSPVREGTYQLLDDLYSDVLPILPFEFFNVCCDETWGLGTKGPSKDLAERIGPGGVYVRHIRRVYDLVHGKYGKRMMMWGDVILKHPDQLSRIPKDVVMLTWGYRPKDSFEDQIVPFAESGYDYFVCPGVNNWNRVLPDFAASVVNIRNFVRDGLADTSGQKPKKPAAGVLITSWDDDGENLNAPNWYGFAWGAECAWNASRTPVEAFDRRVGAVLFGEPGDHFGRAIRLLSDPSVSDLRNRAFWADDTKPIRPEPGEPALQRLKIIREAMEHLEACREEATVDADLLAAVLFGARRMEFYYQRSLDQIEAATAYQKALAAGRDRDQALESPMNRVTTNGTVAEIDRALAAVRRIRDTYTGLRERWQKLWLDENKPYALDWSLARYDEAIGRYDRLLARLDAARKAAREGKPLPAAAEVGLEIGGPRKAKR